MTGKVQKHFDTVLNHLYINPLEKCNLRCKICYTRKTSPILSQDKILEFISRYRKAHNLETVTFCGGEVFTLPFFTKLINALTVRGIFVQIITNGTIDRLEDISSPNLVNCIVSLDGLAQYHDANRGIGNYRKSIAFLKHARKLGCHVEIFSIVTGQNYPTINEFEKSLFKELCFIAPVTYHPRKPPSYLLHHPVSNIFGEVQGFDILTRPEMIDIMRDRKTFPPENLGCYQIALVSDGKIFGCCEGIVPIGKIDDEIEVLFNALAERIEKWERTNSMKHCLGCSQPEFMCGIKEYLLDKKFDSSTV